MRIGSIVITETRVAVALLLILVMRGIAVQLANHFDDSGLSPLAVGISGDVLFVADLLLLAMIGARHRLADTGPEGPSPARRGDRDPDTLAFVIIIVIIALIGRGGFYLVNG